MFAERMLIHSELRPQPRLLFLLLALASAAAVPVRPSLHGLSPLLPAIARSRRRGPAPLAAQARAPAVSTKLEVLDAAAQLAVSVATSQLTQAMRLKAMHDRQLNEEEYASLISLAGASPTLAAIAIAGPTLTLTAAALTASTITPTVISTTVARLARRRRR